MIRNFQCRAKMLLQASILSKRRRTIGGSPTYHGVTSTLGTFTRSNTNSILSVASVVSSLILLSLMTEDYVKCDRESFSINEIASMLKEQLKQARGKLQKAGKEAPLITVRSIRFPERDIDTQVLDMRVSPDCNIDGLVSAWLDVFEDPVDKKRTHLEKLKAFYGNKNQFNLPLVSVDKSKSMTITKYVTSSDTKISVSLFKDHGYNEKDIKCISKGYEEGLCRKTFPKVDFQLDQDIMPKSFDHLIGPLKKFFPSEENADDGTAFMKSITDSDMNDGYTKKDGKGSQAAAISKLESLGVEVFDAANQPHLSWDALAGYEHVKKDIEDTVLNALKYPDIYDQIAQRTRVVFESNRPKAILLEGPPGTGKTLSARILASECESTLVILRLESIVSKWYGDSEKKLAKILDACDDLSSAIIFVDEIDALAQSRESENGIHEVSKRILSVLLQRLEGFHGKSKSILICATNRKQDLDPALLSRFDLMIPFALPDFPTRVEIFHRYAKQFQNTNQDTYSELSRLSQGLSCRDIKEACEQAERKCASRLVKKVQDGKTLAQKTETKGGWLSSMLSNGTGDDISLLTPTIEDYKYCLQIKVAEARSRQNGSVEPYSSV